MKNNLYLIAAVLVIIALFSSAAICNFGGAAADNEVNEQDEESGFNAQGTSPVANESASKDDKSGSQSGSQGPGDNSSDDKDSGNSNSSSNQIPVIIDINVSSSDLDIGTPYDVTGDATDPDNDTLTYKWSVDGGSIDDPSKRTMVWTTPMFPETYHLKLEINDGKGGKAEMTKAVRVEDLASAIGQKSVDNPPVIKGFYTIPGGPVFTDSKYILQVGATDPDNDIVKYDFTVSGGTLSNLHGNTVDWNTPSVEDFYTVSVTVTDSQGNAATHSEDIGVEIEWVEVK